MALHDISIRLQAFAVPKFQSDNIVWQWIPRIYTSESKRVDRAFMFV